MLWGSRDLYLREEDINRVMVSLHLVRTAYPIVRKVENESGSGPALDFTDSASAVIRRTLGPTWTPDTLVRITGLRALDSLNAALGVRLGIPFYQRGARSAFLAPDRPMNAFTLIDRYEHIPGVRGRYAGMRIGSPAGQVSVSRHQRTPTVRVRLGWGDCMMGCIASHTWEFTVDLRKRTVRLLRESGAPVPDYMQR